jgi:hypothetical protein
MIAAALISRGLQILRVSAADNAASETELRLKPLPDKTALATLFSATPSSKLERKETAQPAELKAIRTVVNLPKAFMTAVIVS